MNKGELLDDKRTIDSVMLHPFTDESNFYCTGPGRHKNCDALEVYEDYISSSRRPWIRVIKNGQVWVRVPACYCEITYRLDPQPSESDTTIGSKP